MVTVSSTVLDEDQNRVVPFFLVLISFRFHSFDQKVTLSRQSMYPTEFEDLILEHYLVLDYIGKFYRVFWVSTFRGKYL